MYRHFSVTHLLVTLVPDLSPQEEEAQMTLGTASTGRNKVEHSSGKADKRVTL
jgi:hypothetical protein